MQKKKHFRIVTADSIDTEFDKVLMRIGTDLGGSYRPIGGASGEEEKKRAEYESRIIGATGKTIKELREGFEKMIAEKKAEAETEAKEGGEPMFPVVSACAPNSSSYLTYYDFAASVEDECDFENCGTWSYNDVEVQLIRQFNNFEVLPDSFISICSLSDTNRPLGQSTSVSYERIRKDQSGNWVNSWNLFPCRTNDKKIEFRIVDVYGLLPVPIFTDFLADVCYSIISNDGFTLINDTTELKNQNIVQNAQIAFNDICGHYCYPQVLSSNGYVLKEVTELHELLHLSHYDRIINDNRTSILIENLKEFSYSCKEYKMFFKDLDEVVTEVKSEIYGFIYESQIMYAQQSGVQFRVGEVIVVPANPVTELRNERNIQSNDFLRKLIDDYHFALARERGTPYPATTCNPCPI
jgi:hypothetical protein